MAISASGRHPVVMLFDPAISDLSALFSDPSMFDSRERWRAAGFDVVDRDGAKEIMVASHPSVPGYMFKKYTNKVSSKDQLKNYQLRIDGSVALKKLIAERSLSRILAPQKWLRALPAGKAPYVLLVERLSVLDRRATRAAYANVNEATLRELCVVVRFFPGLDSGARNMLLTPEGQIAFIDTERWKSKHKKTPLKHIRDYLTPAQIVFAEQTFKSL
jgi:hypothetical protein